MTDEVAKPRPGYYQTKLVRNGPWVPAFIQEVVSKRLRYACQVGNDPADPYEVWPMVAGHRISVARYRYLLAEGEWCRKHAPEEPAADPKQAIDVGKMKPQI